MCRRDALITGSCNGSGRVGTPGSVEGAWGWAAPKHQSCWGWLPAPAGNSSWRREKWSPWRPFSFPFSPLKLIFLPELGKGDLFLSRPLCLALAKCWSKMLDPSFWFPICNSATTTLSGSWLLQLRPWAWKAPALADGLVCYRGSAQQLQWPRAWWWGSPLATKPAGWTGWCTWR